MKRCKRFQSDQPAFLKMSYRILFQFLPDRMIRMSLFKQLLHPLIDGRHLPDCIERMIGCTDLAQGNGTEHLVNEITESSVLFTVIILIRLSLVPLQNTLIYERLKKLPCVRTSS